GETVVKTWDFNDGIGGWQNAGWDWQYDGTAATVEAESGMLKVAVDYSKGADNSCSQIGIGEWGKVDLKDVTKTTFDFYYDPAKLTKGTFTIKEVLQADEDGNPSAVEETASIDTESAVDADVEGLSGWKKVPVSITFDPITKDICNVVLCLVSQNTTYAGALYIDNLEMKAAAAAEDIYVDATKETKEQSPVSVADGKLKTFDKSGAEKTTALSDSIKMVDGNADAGTKAIYSYLQAMGASDSVIFGHQDDTWQKAGSSELSSSDTEDVVGSIAGVVGIDTLSMVGNEWSAERYNKEIVATEELPDTEKLPETAAGNVTAAAKLTNRNIADGAIITLSAHMPNFSIVKENAGYDAAKDPTYAKYDFSGYTPNTISNDVMNEILPGGAYNEVYKAFLDMVADYASQVEGTVLFRPFHENTGSWFWWGKAFCNASTYKNVFRYTVEYLRDTKNVHNFIYVYGPGSEAASVEEYGERYPGDAYVDMVGFDMYHRYVKADDTWFTSFKEELKIVDDFAKAHGKLIAVTETGVASDPDKGDNQTALHKTGNEQKDWYNTKQNAVSESNASYFLLWANFSEKDGFYTPYVKSVSENGVLHGHEMLDNFIDFYNDPRSVFAKEQKTALAGLKDTVKPAAAAAQESAFGYIIAPVGGRRILEPVTLTAYVSGITESTVVKFDCFSGKDAACGETKVSGNTATAELSAADLASLPEGVGEIRLYIDGQVADEINVIFNIPEPVKDPYEIDSFETYFGEASIIQKEWATNKGTGCTIDLALTNDTDKVYDGSYSLKFSYSENGGGWAG
ncbi:MAG: endoglucanase, partial [Lachnospiraceae bacterium]|nr:endoglucanase [Lachnospiraceae bacterium]